MTDHTHECCDAHDHDHEHDHAYLHAHGIPHSHGLIQLAAVRSALDNTGKVILKDHMRHCMVDAVAAGDQDAIDDLCQAIDKFMK